VTPARISRGIPVAVALVLVGSLVAVARWTADDGRPGGGKPACVRIAARVHLARPLSAGWIGGDAAVSVPLVPPRSLWLFGDSLFVGRSGHVHLVRNALVVDSPDVLRTLRPTSGHRSFVRPPGEAPESERWFWPGHGISGPRGLWLLLSEMRSVGADDPAWNFAFVRTWVAEMSARTWRIRRLVPVVAPAGIVWGAWVLRRGRRLYVFGVEDRGQHKDVVLARPWEGRLRAPWEVWTGQGWSAGGRPSPVARDVGAQIGVAEVAGGYAMITQVGISSSVRLEVLRSRSLQGPWGRREVLHVGPRLPHRITYNASVHPEYGRGAVLVSVSSAVDNPLRIFKEPGAMRPRFFWVQRSCLALGAARPG
jgi:hypothetical protein